LPADDLPRPLRYTTRNHRRTLKEMKLALEVLVVGDTVFTVVVVLALFLWAAVKDGQANDAVQARILHRNWPRHQA
jgi:hypothetical protein